VPATTPVHAFPYPTDTDSADIGYWLQQLALGVEADLPRLKVLTFTAQTTDANGYVTVTHGLGWTPSLALVVPTQPGSSFGHAWGADSFTTTTARIRFATAAATGAPASASTGTFAVLFAA